MSAYLSPNFSWAELTKSQTAARLGIENDPPDAALSRLARHVHGFLQPLRDRLARPVTVSSGYRSPALCQAIGSSPHSRHVSGDALDAECFSLSTAAFALSAYNLAREIADGAASAARICQPSPPSKIILECFVPQRRASGWVHLGFFRQGECNAESYRAPRLLAYEKQSGYYPLSPERLTRLAQAARAES